jgi:hypothetical protein
MGERRTAWHYFLGLLLTEKAPRCFEVQPEVPLTLAVQRIDYLLLRRRPWSGAPDRGETLVGLWPELPLVSLAEYKSAHWPSRVTSSPPGLCRGAPPPSAAMAAATRRHPTTASIHR